MDRRFKWNMFITSFIPLWLSIIVVDIWSVVENGIVNWSSEKSIVCNLILICQENLVSLAVVLVILVLMFLGIYSINRFW